MEHIFSNHTLANFSIVTICNIHYINSTSGHLHSNFTNKAIFLGRRHKKLRKGSILLDRVTTAHIMHIVNRALVIHPIVYEPISSIDRQHRS